MRYEGNTSRNNGGYDCTDPVHLTYFRSVEVGSCHVSLCRFESYGDNSCEFSSAWGEMTIVVRDFTLLVAGWVTE